MCTMFPVSSALKRQGAGIQGTPPIRLLYAKAKSPWNLRAGLPLRTICTMWMNVLCFQYIQLWNHKRLLTPTLRFGPPANWMLLIIRTSLEWSHPTKDFPSAYSSYLYIFYSSTHGRDQVEPSSIWSTILMCRQSCKCICILYLRLATYYCVYSIELKVWESSNLDTWSPWTHPASSLIKS